MTARDFAFWLQGFFEVTNPSEITAPQTTMIKKHLALVFKHEIDPSMGDQEHQNELNSLHHSDVNIPFKQQESDPSEGLMRC